MTIDLVTFAQQVLNGLVLSTLLFMTAAGLSLILGLMDVINLTHGSFYLLGGYLGLSLIRETGNFWLSAVLAACGVGMAGWALQHILLRRVRHRGHLQQVLLTFGLALVAADLMRATWGSDVQSIPAPAPLAVSIRVLGGLFPLYRLSIIGLGLLVAATLWILLVRTRLGAIVRAGVADGQMVEALGIEIERVFTVMFALGAALAALAGFLAGPILNVYPGLDFEVLVLAMVVVVVGGLGTLRGAILGALLVGMVDTFGKAYVPQVSLVAVFGAMALTLLFRPGGLVRSGKAQ
jgi:branched-subunit amino acid ABC-type transport system permease component